MSLTAEKTLPYPDVIPYDKQSIPVPGTKRPGQTGKLKHVELSASLNTFSLHSPLSEWYDSLCKVPTAFDASIGIWGLTDLNTPNALRTLDEIFETGLKAGKDREFLGHRPIISTSPLKFANNFLWQTYSQVDVRRRHVGSALASLFQKGELGGGEYETVGIWSANRPGELMRLVLNLGVLSTRHQSGKLWMSLSSLMTRYQ